MKKPAYSYSALEMFFGGPTHCGCPYAYQKVRIEKIPREDSEPLLIGRDAHKLAADYLSHLIETGQQTDWERAESLLACFSHLDVIEIFRQFYGNFILPPIQKPGVEKRLAFNRAWLPVDWFAPDAFFRMILDFTFLQDGLAVVIDFKTNRAIIEIDPENTPLQLRIYAWGALRAIFPQAQEVLLRLHFMRYGKEPDILLTPDQLEGVPKELEEKIAIIEAERHFNPTPGSFCGWCGVTAHCPVMSKALIPVEILAPATREQATKAATLLLAIGEMEKDLAARLKDWVKEHGPLAVGDLIFGPVPSLKYEMDAETVTVMLQDLGVDREIVWQALNISKSSINSALSKSGYKGKRKGEREVILEQVLAAVPSKIVEEIRFFKSK